MKRIHLSLARLIDLADYLTLYWAIVLRAVSHLSSLYVLCFNSETFPHLSSGECFPSPQAHIKFSTSTFVH